MKFSTLTKDIVPKLKLLLSTTGKTPILGLVKIMAQNDGLILMTTNGYHLLAAKCGARIEEPGVEFTDLRMLYDLVSKSKDVRLDFEVVDGNMVLKTATANIELSTGNGDDFPSVSKVQKQFPIDKAVKNALVMARNFVAKDVDKAYLCGVHFTGESVLASDNHSVLRLNIPFPYKLTLPIEVVNILTTILGDESFVTFYGGEIYVWSGDYMLVASVIQEVFPSEVYLSFFPGESANGEIQVDSSEFINYLGQIEPVSKDFNGAFFLRESLSVKSRHASVEIKPNWKLFNGNVDVVLPLAKLKLYLGLVKGSCSIKVYDEVTVVDDRFLMANLEFDS